MKGLFSKNLIANVNPDGDAIGAMAGLGLFLKEQGYQVTMACPTPYPEFLDFLDKDKEILIYVLQQKAVSKAIEQADLIIAIQHRIKF